MFMDSDHKLYMNQSPVLSTVSFAEMDTLTTLSGFQSPEISTHHPMFL